MIIDGWVNLPPAPKDGELPPELSAVADFFGPGSSLFDTRSVDELLAMLDAAGVDRALLCAELPIRADGMDLLHCPLDEALKLAEGSDRLKLIVLVPGVRDLVPTNRMLRELAADDRVAGCVVMGGPMGIDLTDRRLYAIYSTLAELELPLMTNVGILGPPRPSKHQHPLLLEEICSDFPGLVVIGAHVGHPWERLMIRLMMKFPNLYMMTSAYLPKYLDPSIIEFMATKRGAGKVIWASDFPMLDIARCLDEAKKLALPDDALDQYLGGTLSKILGWE